jgi:hypothetical protein
MIQKQMCVTNPQPAFHRPAGCAQICYGWRRALEIVEATLLLGSARRIFRDPSYPPLGTIIRPVGDCPPTRVRRTKANQASGA